MKKFIVSCLCLFGAGVFVASAQEQEQKQGQEQEKSSVLSRFSKAELAKMDMESDRMKLNHSNAIWVNCGDKPCPEFSYTDTAGKLWTHETIRGKVTLINFWYIGCEPCIREMPWLNSLKEKYPDGNYLSCTFNYANQITKIVENTPFLYAHLTDALPLFSAYGVTMMPVTIILDKDTNLFAVVTGSSAVLQRAVETKLKEAFAKE